MPEPRDLRHDVEKPRQERGESLDLARQRALTPEQKMEQYTAYWVEHAQERRKREKEAARVAELETQ